MALRLELSQLSSATKSLSGASIAGVGGRDKGLDISIYVVAENASGSNTQCGWVVRSRPASRSVAVTYKTKTPRNNGDTSVVSSAGTPIPKSVRELMSSRRGRALARSGQAEPAADGTCVRKGVTGGAQAPRPAHTGRRGTRQDGEARAPIKPSVNRVWSALLGSDIRDALGTRGGSDSYSSPSWMSGSEVDHRVSSAGRECSLPWSVATCRSAVGGKQGGSLKFDSSKLAARRETETSPGNLNRRLGIRACINCRVFAYK
ncbi:hypothetical protein TIFTF001_031351 [Ficus carica]|uniref:Uncharacterized protein n=1 Tax=Ficus carica TaxID=3494 RepID=A0AA88DVB6_FICCA|nr:hypothetical protein TIFTF001_031351 [Ficus carica]